MVVALAVKLTGACQLKPGLEVHGHGALQQGTLGVARVVGLGGLGRLGLQHLRLGVQRGMVAPARVLVKTPR